MSVFERRIAVNRRKKRVLNKSVCIFALLAILLPLASCGETEWVYPENVTVGYDGPESQWIHVTLAPYTEEEMFAMEYTAIFRGEILSLENITIDLNGDKEYRAVARVKVSKSFKGDFRRGQTVRMLLPCAMGVEYTPKTYGLAEQLEVGMEGIFMPHVYDGDSIWRQGGVTLDPQDLAHCGLGDGQRWMFLKPAVGKVLYSHHYYPGAEGCISLDEIEEYVKSMLDRVEEAGLVVTKPTVTESTGRSPEDEKLQFTEYTHEIFRGEILSIENLAIERKDRTEYWAVAEIRIDRVLFGNETAGEHIRILLPGGLGEHKDPEDDRVFTKMEVGMEGIFMPGPRYENPMTYDVDGVMFYFDEVSDCSFGNGESELFLQTKDGILFWEYLYPGAIGLETLDEIEAYIEDMLAG